MAKYKKMYLKLFNAATDAIRFIDADEPENAKARLIAAQQAAEEIFITPPLEALREKLRRKPK